MPAIDRVHSPTPEELMAYLDGESPANARNEIEIHVTACAECRQVISDLGGVNRTMAAWQPENAPATLRPPRVARAIGWTLPAFSWRPGYLVMSVTGVVATALLVVTLASVGGRTAKVGAYVMQTPAAVDEAKAPQATISARKATVDGRFVKPESQSTAAPKIGTMAETVTVPRQPSVIRTA